MGWLADARTDSWNCHVVGVKPFGRVDAEHVRRPIGLAGLEHDLAGMQQLAGLHVATTVGQALGEQRVVPAPGNVDAVHLAVPLTEAAFAGEHERRGFVRGPATTVLDEQLTLLPVTANRMQLT